MLSRDSLRHFSGSSNSTAGTLTLFPDLQTYRYVDPPPLFEPCWLIGSAELVYIPKGLEYTHDLLAYGDLREVHDDHKLITLMYSDGSTINASEDHRPRPSSTTGVRPKRAPGRRALSSFKILRGLGYRDQSVIDRPDTLNAMLL